MIDQLIEFQTAKLAKEKGFNEVCIDIFSDTGIAQYRYNLDIDNIKSMRKLKEEFEITNSELEQIAKDCKITPYIARPSQSLLQRWLREVHKIDVFSIKLKAVNKYIWEANTNEQREGWYNTYEEALEEGLKAGLNLIP